ncbi:hypothetical protein DAEQUDRAFT_372184 [Daedalea quercina L-15889]|uniref:Uncharacterized protein n=1 Tax=Daedalea quercina L-15889 TaxID=1314783 RepID=A0A165P637_9APHY|nr:hypothetical protein DAEQUDRAFT_372184 [Daedalea quercina L-15889]
MNLWANTAANLQRDTSTQSLSGVLNASLFALLGLSTIVDRLMTHQVHAGITKVRSSCRIPVQSLLMKYYAARDTAAKSFAEALDMYEAVQLLEDDMRENVRSALMSRMRPLRIRIHVSSSLVGPQYAHRFCCLQQRLDLDQTPALWICSSMFKSILDSNETACAFCYQPD